MKTHKTMLKNQAVFSYSWVARISCLRLSACVGAQAGLDPAMPVYKICIGSINGREPLCC